MIDREPDKIDTIIRKTSLLDGVDNYVFDLYGTLVDIHTDESSPELWKNMAELGRSFGAEYTAENLQREYLREVHAQEEKLRLRNPDEKWPEISIEYVFRNLMMRKGIELTIAEIVSVGMHFREWSTEYIRLYPGARELLTFLHKQGKVWLLSNAQRIFTRPELNLLGITSLFDGIYLSSEWQCRKPSANFYRLLLEREEIDPEHAVMIGNDGTCDIAGAKKVGMKTIYLKSDLSPKEDCPEADLVMDPLNLPMLKERLIR